MTCAEAEELLDDYVDGDLPEAQVQALELHIRDCPGCREQERRLRTILAQAGALPRSLAPARDLWPGIEDRIREGHRRRLWQIWGGAGLAAAAVLASALSPTLRPRPAVPPAGVPVVASRGGDNLPEVEAEYARASAALLDALREQGSSPDTLANVQKNLEIIDGALAEVREALRKDPHNSELTHMLVATHRKKLDVLRRVVKLSTPL